MKKFTILGERCSGTNYLESLITKNFDVEVTWEYGWKHFFGFNDLANSDDTLFIGIVRDPHTWMNSLWREKHHLQPGLRSNIKSYLNEEFWSYYDAIKHKSTGLYGKERMEDRNIYTGHRYENIFEMRKTKLKYLIEDMPNKVKNYIYNDESSGSHCPNCAFGELYGKLDSCGNVFTDCFNCQDFNKRKEGDKYETILVKE